MIQGDPKKNHQKKNKISTKGESMMLGKHIITII
jgi:hypothetical protein